MQTDRFELILKYLAGAVLIGILAFFTYIGKVSADVLVAVVTATFGGLGVHVAGRAATVNNFATVGSPKKESGFARTQFLGFVLGGVMCALAGAAFLTSCATTTSTTTTDTTDTTVTVTTVDTTKICNSTQAILTTLKTLSTTLTTISGYSDVLSSTSTLVSDICASASATSTDATYLTQLSDTYLPDLAAIINASTLDATTKTAVTGSIAAAIVILDALETTLLASDTTSSAAKAVLRAGVQKRKAMLEGYHKMGVLR